MQQNNDEIILGATKMVNHKLNNQGNAFSPSNHPTSNAAKANRKARKQTKNICTLVK